MGFCFLSVFDYRYGCGKYTMSMGMFMLPPVMISLPLNCFYCDGGRLYLVVKSVVESFL